MQSLISALRDVLGIPDFYVQLPGQSNYSWDYGAIIEYMVGAMLLMICVSWLFRFVRWLFNR